MGNAMEETYNKAIKGHSKDLRESVDHLRLSVRDLYELDEDNYQLIKVLQKSRTEMELKIKNLTNAVTTSRKRLGFGLIVFGCGLALIRRYLRIHDEQIDELNAKIEELEGSGDKSEESDG